MYAISQIPFSNAISLTHSHSIQFSFYVRFTFTSLLSLVICFARSSFKYLLALFCCPSKYCLAHEINRIADNEWGVLSMRNWEIASAFLNVRLGIDQSVFYLCRWNRMLVCSHFESLKMAFNGPFNKYFSLLISKTYTHFHSSRHMHYFYISHSCSFLPFYSFTCFCFLCVIRFNFGFGELHERRFASN